MLNLGIIGTSQISAQFVDALQTSTDTFTPTALYSRHKDRGVAFAQENFQTAPAIFTSLETFFASPVFDTVYVASPNSLHFEKVKQAILAGKNVIVEKPAFSNPDEMKVISQLLEEHPEVFLFEAARHIYTPNFQAVSKQVNAFEHVDGATLTYMKYSSRFDKVLAGEVPNIFSPDFSGGALQDLGVYVVYEALIWFGMPDEVAYFPTMIDTGVDAKGTAIFKYPNMQVTLMFGKNVQSYLPSEIYSGKETITMDNAGELNRVGLQKVGDESTILGTPTLDNPMIPEAKFFAKTIKDHDVTAYQQQLKLSQQVNQLLYDLRKGAGIVFAADKKEATK